MELHFNAFRYNLKVLKKCSISGPENVETRNGKEADFWTKCDTIWLQREAFRFNLIKPISVIFFDISDEATSRWETTFSWSQALERGWRAENETLSLLIPSEINGLQRKLREGRGREGDSKGKVKEREERERERERERKRAKGETERGGVLWL